MWTFGVFLKPIVQDFQWSRAQVSSGYTAFLIGYVISVIMTGSLADRYAPGPILLVSAILTGLGFTFCSQVYTVNQLRLFLFIGGLGGGANWSVPTTTIQRWFFTRKQAGLALGITISGVGVGALIFALLANYLVSTSGWRAGYLIVGLLFFSIMAASSFFIKASPVEQDTLSDGSTAPIHEPGIQRGQTRKTLLSLPFAGITICHCIAVAAFQIISAHLVPYATDIGIPSMASAAAIGIMGAFSIPGRIISGHLSARIQWQRILTFLMLVWASPSCSCCSCREKKCCTASCSSMVSSTGAGFLPTWVPWASSTAWPRWGNLSGSLCPQAHSLEPLRHISRGSSLT